VYTITDDRIADVIVEAHRRGVAQDDQENVLVTDD